MPSFGSMFQRRQTEWVRTSMRTPAILIFGLVMAPCGWVLTLVTTVAPNWRTLENIPNNPPSRVYEQGIFDICIAASASERQQCDVTDTTYFSNQIITIAQGLMLGSLVVDLIGIAFAIPGVRCWRENPHWALTTTAGFLILIAGVLTLIAVSWYTHIIKEVTSVTPLVTVKAGYCLILGFIGGIFEVVGGCVMAIGCCRCCGGKNRSERPIEEVLGPRGQPKRQPRRVDVPSLSATRISAASRIPPSNRDRDRDSFDDDVSFPRAKSPGAKSGISNASFSGTPYDADL